MTTTAEPQTLTAGRELDALIAEKVMGWTRWDGDADWDGPDDVTFFSVDEHYLAVYGPGSEEPSQYIAFSTDIADAWLVVEKFKQSPITAAEFGYELGPDWFAVESCNLVEYHQGKDETLWSAGWKHNVSREGDYFIQELSAVAETAALAICRAALKMVERRAQAKSRSEE